LILNRTAECRAPNQRFDGLAHIKYLVIHRSSLARGGPDNPNPIPDDELDADNLARVYRENPEPPPDGLGTGGWVPYHILISPMGRVEQTMPLACRGAHAKGYNSESIAVAVIGDPRKRPLPAPQMRALVRTCADLVPINRGLVIGGHTVSFQNASADPNKICPGEHLRIPELVAAVTEKLPPNWRRHTNDELLTQLRLGGYVV
jgi:hypothetical protein